MRRSNYYIDVDEINKIDKIIDRFTGINISKLPKSDKRQHKYINSVDFSKTIGKQHNKILRDIRKYTEMLDGIIDLSDFWEKSVYIDKKGQKRPCYKLTEMGCNFIKIRSTGMKGILEFVDKFEKVRNDYLSRMNNKNNKNNNDEENNKWKTVTFEKLKQIQDVVNNRQVEKEYTLPNIIHEVIINTEDNYNIEMPEYMRMYRYEYNLTENDNVYVLDVIGYYKDLKDMFTETLNSIVKKLKIGKDDKNKSIFDIVAEKINEDENDKNEEGNYDDEKLINNEP